MTAAERALDEDLASARFAAGVIRGQWRLVHRAFPIVIMAVAAADGAEYAFNFELTNFPSTAPAVIIWDTATRTKLAPGRRPNTTQALREAFKDWTAPHSTYRPWDRHAAASHAQWAQAHPALAWNASRDLAFILEDLHGLLCACIRKSA